jgi:hypothetical protein
VPLQHPKSSIDRMASNSYTTYGTFDDTDPSLVGAYVGGAVGSAAIFGGGLAVSISQKGKWSVGAP